MPVHIFEFLFRISRELLDCLKVEEAGFSSVPFSGIDDKMKVSIWYE